MQEEIMSEFSESYHLKANSKQDVMKLIEKVGSRGFVFDEKDGWVSFVIDGSEFIPNDLLLTLNKGILVHYANACDHGFYLSIYYENKLISHYELVFDDDPILNEEPKIKDDRFQIEPLYQLIEENKQDLTLEELQLKLFPENVSEMLYDTSLAEELAQLLGITHYSWISFHYLNNEYKNGTLNNEVTPINFS